MYAARRPIPPLSHRAGRVEPVGSRIRAPTRKGGRQAARLPTRSKGNRRTINAAAAEPFAHVVRTSPRPRPLGAERLDSTFCPSFADRSGGRLGQL